MEVFLLRLCEWLSPNYLARETLRDCKAFIFSIHFQGKHLCQDAGLVKEVFVFQPLIFEFFFAASESVTLEVAAGGVGSVLDGCHLQGGPM